MKIVVTGGAGFIGANFVHHWAERHPHDQIIVIDKLTYAGNPANLESVKDRIKFINTDINDAAACQGAISKADYIVHFAAESHVTRSETDSEVFERSNVQGTSNLLELAQVNSKLRRFIHISTDEVYGDAADGHFFKETEKEPADHQATSAYAKSKSRADDVAKSFADKLPLNIIRPTNNFGPYQYPEKMLPRSITRIMGGKTIPVWGKGNQVRDWLYAPDTARGIELVLKKAHAGETFNIGANNQPEITNRNLAEWLAKRLEEFGAKVEYQPDPRAHHDFRYGVDTTKIKQLGWQPTTDVWQQFEDTVQWYLNNQAWWEPLIKEAESIYALK